MLTLIYEYYTYSYWYYSICLIVRVCCSNKIMYWPAVPLRLVVCEIEECVSQS